ncbi:MAG: apolipoprotein N-acyltransferase [Terriglobia bacterium]
MAALAVLSGIVLILSFPKVSLYPLSAIALSPLIFVVAREPRAGRRVLWGCLAGLVFFAGTSTWIYTVMREFGGLGTLAAAGVLGLLCIILSLYWGCFAWLAGRLWQVRWGPVAVPFLWVSLELARAHLFTGYPWLLLGYAVTDYPSLARLARWTGVYGLSFLLVSFNVAWAWLLLRRDRTAGAFLAILLAGTALLYGTAPAETYRAEQTAFLVQTNIPQEVGREPWTLEAQRPLLERLETLTTDAVGRREPPALVIWPEMPASFYFHDDSFSRPFMEGIARRTNSYFLTGIVAFVPGSERTQPLNSNVLLDPSGELLSQYDKIHLVPFGEYIPWKRFLGFAGSLTAEAGGFVPGSRFVVTQLPGSPPPVGTPPAAGTNAGYGPQGGRVSSIICYEAIFPELSRRFVQEGAEVLVNISNDGWFGRSSARDQHLLIARMRALETRRWLLRATNTGVTAVIDANGRVRATLPPDRPGSLDGRFAYRSDLTPYVRWGDWFWLAALAAQPLVIWKRGRR